MGYNGENTAHDPLIGRRPGAIGRMHMAALFLTALGLAFSGAIMPGPVLTYTIRQSLVSGPKAGFLIMIGHAILEAALIALIFLGFDVILESQGAQIAIGMVGGLLLIYLGVDMIRGAIRNKVHIQMDGKGGGSRSMILSGFLISASNPYFLLWWAIIGLGFLLGAYRSFGVAGVAVFYAGHILADFLWYGSISTVIGKTRRFINERVYRGIVIGLGGLLVYFGGSFVYQAARSLF
jgi:threonine/homoserine/homoserine lactone efflux protein